MTNRPIRCIIAGFDPFGESTFNPSGEIALAFPDLITVPDLADIPTEKVLLPTCCNESWKVLLGALKKFPDDDLVVFLFGLNERGTNLHLERRALNCRKYRIADNNGHKHPQSKIYMSEGEMFSTAVAVESVVSTLVENGIPSEVSDHAGLFVCNEIYFRTLSHQAEHKNLKQSLFIHVPLPESFAASFEEMKQGSQPGNAKKKNSQSKRVDLQKDSKQIDSKSGVKMDKHKKSTARQAESEPSEKSERSTEPQSKITRDPAHMALLQNAAQTAVMECLKTLHRKIQTRP
jgi:pyroglutamyl-peptidase